MYCWIEVSARLNRFLVIVMLVKVIWKVMQENFFPYTCFWKFVKKLFFSKVSEKVSPAHKIIVLIIQNFLWWLPLATQRKSNRKVWAAVATVAFPALTYFVTGSVLTGHDFDRVRGLCWLRLRLQRRYSKCSKKSIKMSTLRTGKCLLRSDAVWGSPFLEKIIWNE